MTSKGSTAQAIKPTAQAEVTPIPIMAVTFAYARTRIAVTALELDIFTKIKHGTNTASGLAMATSSSERGIRILLNGLVGMKLLDSSNGHYMLSPEAEKFLVKDSPAYVGGVVMHSNYLQDTWAHLTDIVRTGRTPQAVDSTEDHGQFFAHFVDSLYALNYPAAEVAAETLMRPGPMRVLDIGAGSGVWSLPFARKNPQARVTVADYDTVVEQVTRQFAAREKVADRFDYLVGNFRDVDFGTDKYDVVTIGHILHSEGPARSQKLLERTHRALKKDGKVMIAEFLADEERREAEHALIFAVNMLAATEEGDTFTFGEIKTMLEGAGFRDVQPLDAPHMSPLIVATK